MNAVVVPPPVADPLVIAWAQEPAYVAQRGLITVSGLSEGETVLSFQATSGADKLRLEPAGATCYAGLLKAGAFTVTVTTSAGRTASLSGTASAPTLQSGTTALYANPDGSPARDGQDGLSGNPLTWRYQGGGTALSVTTAETATGTQLYAPLYDELLSPAFSVSSDRLHLGNDVSELYVTSLEGYPSAGGTELGVLTLKPRDSSSGVAENGRTPSQAKRIWKTGRFWTDTVPSPPIMRTGRSPRTPSMPPRPCADWLFSSATPRPTAISRLCSTVLSSGTASTGTSARTIWEAFPSIRPAR